MDIFVANTVRQVFVEGFDETPNLQSLMVYDEVHRLLPKFGGSGEGFLQIERACREFRKWGIGVILISQTLSDFVGTIKANINTEIQVRTRDEGDLDRLKTKYGEEVLKAVVKTNVGTAMVENPAYNKGNPYLVSFRPLKHSIERLSDEELAKYNHYNEIIDNFDFQLEQLEALEYDTFELKLELKLASSKLKEGKFNMVDIYLESIQPSFESVWKELNKKPKKLVKKLADLSEIKASVAQAQKDREKQQKEDKEKAKENSETSKEEATPNDDTTSDEKDADDTPTDNKENASPSESTQPEIVCKQVTPKKTKLKKAKKKTQKKAKKKPKK
jgi:Ni/Co efflux regulator RcnB